MDGWGVGWGGGVEGKCHHAFNKRTGRWLHAHPLYLHNFPSFIEEKYYFIHAISVHSSAGASLDSQSHLHTNILINGL